MSNYRIENKSAAIKEIQRYLISLTDTVSKVKPNGIYDTATKSEVVRFQNSKKLPATGVVDFETFRLLRENHEYVSQKKQVRSANPDIIFPVKLGDFGIGASKINGMMSKFLQNHKDSIYLRSGTSFSKESVAALKRIREILRLTDSSQADEEFYHKVEKDNNSYFLFEQK